MKKFIKGTFELDKNVVDLAAYEEKHKKGIKTLIEWAESLNVGITIGASDDNIFLCEYKIVGKTTAFCKGLVSELRQILKEEFPQVKSLWQGSGDIWL